MPRQIISDIVKEYPDMLKIVIYHNSYAIGSDSSQTIKKLKSENKKEESIHRSVRRTRSVITDLIIANKFDYWATFTFDKRKVDRYDINRCKTTMSMWLHAQKKHSPSFQYLIVPELHEDGAVHFHAMIKNYHGPLKDTGKKTKRGQTVYKFSSYRSGISDCIPLSGDYEVLGSYMQKYITKDMPLLAGKKRYWASRELLRPVTHVNGIFKLGLQKVIQHHPPAYIDDMMEVQYHQKAAAPLTRERNLQLL